MTIANPDTTTCKADITSKVEMVSCVPAAPPWKCTFISQMPSEVLVRIFLMLSLPEFVYLLTVCRTWNRICKDDFVWKQMLREGQYKLTSKVLPNGFQSWKDLYRVLELYKTFISLSLSDYINKCCSEILTKEHMMTEFTPKIRSFLSHHLHQVQPCDMLLHGHEIADKSGYHHHWCYAAYRKESGMYDFTRYYLGIDRKYHNFFKSHVDMMVKGNVQVHNQHEWICWHLTMHFF